MSQILKRAWTILEWFYAGEEFLPGAELILWSTVDLPNPPCKLILNGIALSETLAGSILCYLIEDILLNIGLEHRKYNGHEWWGDRGGRQFSNQNRLLAAILALEYYSQKGIF